MKPRILPRTALFILFVLAVSAFAARPSVYAAANRHVNPTGSDSGDCTNPATPCQTIAYALGQAIAGDTLLLAAGTYTGPGNQHVIINKAITLDGDGPATTILDYDAGTPNPPMVAKNGLLEIRASGVTIKDLTVRDVPSEGGTSLWGIRLYLAGGTIDDTRIDNVHFLNNSSRGLELHNLTAVTDLTVQNSLFDGNSEHGIRISSDARVSNFDVKNTTFQNNGVAGIRHIGTTSYLQELDVDNAIFTNNAVAGLQLVEVYNSSVHNSSFSGGQYGVWLGDTATAVADPNGLVTINDNTFTNQTLSAIYMEYRDNPLDNANTIAGNTITQNVGLLTATAAAIDLRLHATQAHAEFNVSDNAVTFSGAFGAATAAHALQVRGGADVVNVTGNTFDGGNVGNNGGNPPTSGILIHTDDATYGAMKGTALVNVAKNTIQNFVNGVSLYNAVTPGYGSVPATAAINVNHNALTGNSAFGARSGDANPADTTCNWWGNASGPSGEGPGSGDAVSVQLGFTPWLPTSNLDDTCISISVYDIFVAPNQNGDIVHNGVTISHNDEDILAYDYGTDKWVFLFDGSDVGVTKNLTGFTFDPLGCILMSFNGAIKVTGIGRVKMQDIVRFCPMTLGENTSGTFTWFFDGSDVGLSTSGEIIDAIDLLPDGRLALSTKGTHKVPQTGGGNVEGGKNDILVFNFASYGENTAGTFQTLLAGNDIPGMKKENIIGVWVNPFDGNFYLSTYDDHNLGGVVGDNNDIFIVEDLGGGSYNVMPYWDGDLYGLHKRAHSVSVDLP